MNTLTPARLAQVRTEMARQQLDGFIVPRADEYLGEYVPVQNERLHWLTGFSGSAGMAIILASRAAVFVDGRYTIQVRQQVSAADFEYHHLVDEPPLAWLQQVLSAGARVGVDSRMHTLAWFEQAQATLAEAQIELVEVATNPIDGHWAHRPVPEFPPALLLGEEYTGESSLSKRTRIGALVKAAGAETTLVAQLDAIAWLLNIRGADVPRLPVLLGYAILDQDGAMTLFTNPAQLPNDFSSHAGAGVTVKDASQLGEALQALGAKSARVLADPANTNAWSQLRCREAGATLIAAADPVALPKAAKNPVELAGIRHCHVRDGLAVSQFLAWLDAQVAAGQLLDEAELAAALESRRQASGALRDLSFDTISAAGANGALCHYNHRNGVPARLAMNNLYLVDSGGQYLDGTTDITRTVAIGTPTAEHRLKFTLVLKGHIALARAVFPQGTSGIQLDILARQFLWQAGLDYDHGTGHGVGAFLSVHEGPQRIGKSGPQTALLAGMVLSNEPGYYQENCFGIRCENLMVVVPRADGMLTFETITLAPFDHRLIDTSLLSSTERAWLDSYHARVYATLAADLNGADRQWLQAATASLQ